MGLNNLLAIVNPFRIKRKIEFKRHRKGQARSLACSLIVIITAGFFTSAHAAQVWHTQMHESSGAVWDVYIKTGDPVNDGTYDGIGNSRIKDIYFVLLGDETFSSPEMLLTSTAQQVHEAAYGQNNSLNQ